MAAPEQKPKEEVKPRVAKASEEMVQVGLFTAMVKKIDEIYEAALDIENAPRLAKLLGEVGMVKATLQEAIEALKQEEAMRVAEMTLNAERAKRDDDK